MNQDAFVTAFPRAPGDLFSRICELYLSDEVKCVEDLLNTKPLDDTQTLLASEKASQLVLHVRSHKDRQSALDAFMTEYDLSSEEGIMLMCIAEALLRIPDPDTAEALIRDKLSLANWKAHLGQSSSLLVNASSWGLLLTGKIIGLGTNTRKDPGAAFSRLVARAGEPVIRTAVRHAMKIMGHQFVMGRTIESAIRRSIKKSNALNRYSFDMLGEAALTQKDADKYFASYQHAIEEIAKQANKDDLYENPGLSVKLSALHPRYEATQYDRALKELTPKLLQLAKQAADANINLTVDAEEADRLELSLLIFEKVFSDPSLKKNGGFGLAVQAYQKRAMAVLEWLADLASAQATIIPVRLVKGAYWDTEIKRCQEEGLPDYPVFTRKCNTDLSYLVCARFLINNLDKFYPQFATHNAHTIAAIHTMAKNMKGFEMQRLHGMGQLLYEPVIAPENMNLPVRVYAPVGSHEDLLPYLVRRLLENGANTSFVNRLSDDEQSVTDIVTDPVAEASSHKSHRHPRIPVPGMIFDDFRKNSLGFNFRSMQLQAELKTTLKNLPDQTAVASAITRQKNDGGAIHPVLAPANTSIIVGQWQESTNEQIKAAIEDARLAQPSWDHLGFEHRSQCLEKVADLIEENTPLFIRLCILEAGKTIADAIAEVREAVDFCRYYAAVAQQQFTGSESLPGPTGEENRLYAHGRGVFVCISPWNFPLAIFTGQVAAALVTGNTVLAKPAEQTNLIAWHACKLFHKAGIPEGVLQLLPGFGKSCGQMLCESNLIAGVCFTGSTETARHINLTLASRNAALATLVAETGGQNAMLVDSSALPEQVVKDVLTSAFGSSGQRCSALRVLFVQDDIADNLLEMLAGAMAELVIDDPRWLATDMGPVIDNNALDVLSNHIESMSRQYKLVAKGHLSEEMANQGHFLAPHVFEIPDISVLEKEVFGPVLHIIRYKNNELDTIIDQINSTGYGLTLGIHSRIEQKYKYIHSRCKVGNCYINRNMIGAMVGVQPFGGEGLSGTGPKAGGPHYLYRFITERTRTINTSAIGGNATLLELND